MSKFSDASRVIMGMKPSEYQPIFSTMGIELDQTIHSGLALIKALKIVRESDRRDEFVLELDSVLVLEKH
jgi:hypothetical protein